MVLKKIQSYLFLVLIFLLPSNMAYHFILPSSYVHGILVDYLVPSICLTDIVIGLILFLWLMKAIFQINNYQLAVIKQCPKFNYQTKKKISKFLIFLLFVTINVFVAENKIAASYKWLKIAEIGLLYIYIKTQTFDKKYISKIYQVLSLSIVWQSILTIAQWFKGSNIFPYWTMGESQFSVSTANIKTIDWFGAVKAVPMGTFPHPNILAAWLVFSLFVLLKCCFLTDDRHPFFNNLARRARLGGAGFSALALVLVLVFGLGIAALFLTFSLPAWGLFLLIILNIKYQKYKIHIRNIKHSNKLGRLIFLGFCGIAIAVFGWGLANFTKPSSWTRRAELNKIAVKMWQSSPIFGVGLNNFTVRMSDFGEIVGNIRFLQPVHNVWLLVLAETGIIGLLLTAYGFWRFIQSQMTNNKKQCLYGYMAVLFLSFFDHFWLTSQQGLLLLVLFFGIFCYNSTNDTAKTR